MKKNTKKVLSLKKQNNTYEDASMYPPSILVYKAWGSNLTILTNNLPINFLVL
jgi:hypothetical protein